MSRKLAIFFSILIILTATVMEVGMLWNQVYARSTIRRDIYQLIAFIGFIATGLIFLVYHIFFLLMLKKFKTRQPVSPANPLTRLLSFFFGMSVFLWLIIWIFGFYSTFIKPEGSFTDGLLALILIFIFIFMNCYVWVFSNSLRKKYLTETINEEIDAIGNMPQ